MVDIVGFKVLIAVFCCILSNIVLGSFMFPPPSREQFKLIRISDILSRLLSFVKSRKVSCRASLSLLLKL